MGLFDFITGGSPPDPGVPQAGRAELLQRLLAVRDPGGAWRVRPAHDEEGADLVAEWDEGGGSVRGVLAASETRETFQILMRLVEEQHVVRSVDKEVTASWSADVARLHFAAARASFRGQKVMVGGSVTLGRKPDGHFGMTEEDHWGTSAIKRPLHATAAAAGWGWRGVAFGKL